MRTLMITDVFFPRVNGVSTSVESFRHALAELDIEVDIVAPAYPARHADDASIARVPSRKIPFDPEDRLMHFGVLRRTLAALVAAGKRNYALVHIQTPFAAHYAGLRFARDNGIPCLATYHTHFEEYLHNYVPGVPRSWLRTLARNLARRQCNDLDAVIVPSAAMHDTLRDYGVTAPLHRVPTGIPTALFHRPASADFRQCHRIPATSPIALFVGRAAHEKNIDFLLNALPHALARCPSLVLVIAGEGPALPALQRLAATLGIEAQLRFVGYLDRATELPDCYAAADLFVFASRTETQGLVLLEAMAAGLPVLAFSALGTREIVEPRRGALPAPQEPAAFGAAMAALIDDLPQLQQMSAAARVFAEEWTTATCAARMAAVYRDSIAQAQRLVPALASP